MCSIRLCCARAVFALARLYGLELAEEGYDLTVVARQGSGSACRSLMGGFVEWTAGTRGDGLDSRAVQVSPLPARGCGGTVASPSAAGSTRSSLARAHILDSGRERG